VLGNYALAVLIVDVIARAVAPFVAAQFPHFTDLIARKAHEQLSIDYHRITIVVAAVALPAALLLCSFAPEILQLVSGSHAMAEQFALVLAIRALATAINVLQWLPHAMQLASGLSAFVLVVNIVDAAIYLPGILLLTPAYGVIVPALLWLIVNVLQFAPMIAVTHRRALRGEASAGVGANPAAVGGSWPHYAAATTKKLLIARA
jgi:O-antigen/teichoic acid export membrane protein